MRYVVSCAVEGGLSRADTEPRASSVLSQNEGGSTGRRRINAADIKRAMMAGKVSNPGGGGVGAMGQAGGGGGEGMNLDVRAVLHGGRESSG